MASLVDPPFVVRTARSLSSNQERQLHQWVNLNRENRKKKGQGSVFKKSFGPKSVGQAGLGQQVRSVHWQL